MYSVCMWTASRCSVFRYFTLLAFFVMKCIYRSCLKASGEPALCCTSWTDARDGESSYKDVTNLAQVRMLYVQGSRLIVVTLWRYSYLTHTWKKPGFELWLGARGYVRYMIIMKMEFCAILPNGSNYTACFLFIFLNLFLKVSHVLQMVWSVKWA